MLCVLSGLATGSCDRVPPAGRPTESARVKATSTATKIPRAKVTGAGESLGPETPTSKQAPVTGTTPTLILGNRGGLRELSVDGQPAPHGGKEGERFVG